MGSSSPHWSEHPAQLYLTMGAPPPPPFFTPFKLLRPAAPSPLAPSFFFGSFWIRSHNDLWVLVGPYRELYLSRVSLMNPILPLLYIHCVALVHKLITLSHPRAAPGEAGTCIGNTDPCPLYRPTVLPLPHAEVTAIRSVIPYIILHITFLDTMLNPASCCLWHSYVISLPTVSTTV